VESAIREKSIHTIVEAAKVASYSTSNSDSPSVKKSPESTSIVAKIKNMLFTGEFSKPIGVGFACVAMVAVLGPMYFKTSNDIYFSETAHLIDCSQCDAYINNALATTRSTLSGQNQVSLENKFAARLGVIQARLKIEALQNQTQAINNALQQINRQPKQLLNAELVNFTEQNAKLGSLVLAIDASTNDLALTRAGEALFIADITARFIADSKQTSLTQDSFNKALIALKGIDAPTTLQQAAISKLERSINTQPQNSKRIVEDVKFASRALGL